MGQAVFSHQARTGSDAYSNSCWSPLFLSMQSSSNHCHTVPYSGKNIFSILYFKCHHLKWLLFCAHSTGQQQKKLVYSVQCVGFLSHTVPFSTWCLAACGSSPRARRWCLTHGNTPSEGNGRWAPGGPAPPRWSRSPVRWGSGYAPSVPTLERITRVTPLY